MSHTPDLSNNDIERANDILQELANEQHKDSIPTDDERCEYCNIISLEHSKGQ